jgi:DNA-binding MarR family transcriptional regulator
VSSITFIDYRPSEAVSKARDLAAQGHEDAWDALDRHLRWHLMNHVQNRTEDLDDFRGALLEACHWADREEREPWRTRWPYLLELMTDADRQPSLATGLQAVEGRAAEMLALLAGASEPLRPSDVSDAMGISPQQASNLGQKLEAAGLIVRRKTGGRFTWMFLTPQGRELAGLLPGIDKSAAASAPPAAAEAEPLELWNQDALDEAA